MINKNGIPFRDRERITNFKNIMKKQQEYFDFKCTIPNRQSEKKRKKFQLETGKYSNEKNRKIFQLEKGK